MIKNQMDNAHEQTIPVISALTASADVEKRAQQIAIDHFTTHQINPLAAHQAHSVAPGSELGHHWAYLEKEIIEQVPEGSFFGLGIERVPLNTMEPHEQEQWQQLMNLTRGEGRKNLWIWTEQEQAGFICVTDDFETMVTGPTERANCVNYIHKINNAHVVDVNGQLNGPDVPQEAPLNLRSYHFDLVVQIEEEEPFIIPLNDKLEVIELGDELTTALGPDGVNELSKAINEQIKDGTSSFQFTTFTDGSWAQEHGQEPGRQVADYVTAAVTYRKEHKGFTEDRYERIIDTLQLPETEAFMDEMTNSHGCRMQ